MSDLVKRLRRKYININPGGYVDDLLKERAEAADEIERLNRFLGDAYAEIERLRDDNEVKAYYIAELQKRSGGDNG